MKVSKFLLIPLLSVVSVVQLTGCATMSANNNRVALSKTAPSYQTESALDIVSQESQKALLAQQVLTKYRQTYSETMDYRQRSFEQDRVMIDYIGRPQTALASIAIKYGYRFIEQGTMHDLPVVNFTQYYATPEQIVVSIDAQIGGAAKVSVDKHNKVITLIY